MFNVRSNNFFLPLLWFCVYYVYYIRIIKWSRFVFDLINEIIIPTYISNIPEHFNRSYRIIVIIFIIKNTEYTE